MNGEIDHNHQLHAKKEKMPAVSFKAGHILNGSKRNVVETLGPKFLFGSRHFQSEGVRAARVDYLLDWPSRVC